MWGKDADLRTVMAVEELKNYNETVRRCFKECVWALTCSTLTAPEQNCMDNCFSKVVKFNERMAELMTSEAQSRAELGK